MQFVINIFKMPPQYLCQNFDIESILKCSFGLSDAELKVFIELLNCNKKKECVNNLAEKLGRDRSTIQKIVLRLSEVGLVLKEKKILKEGGHIFYYIPLSKEELRKTMILTVEEWHKSVKNAILNW